MQYKSKISIVGVPLIHIAVGGGPENRHRRGVARGWVAVGDIAFGLFLSVGGIAVGGVAIGGLAIGGIGFAGLGLAVYAVGGGAIGVYSIGGLALGGYAALGGAAVATKYAVGGYAAAEHANDPVAREFMMASLMRYGAVVARHARWLIALAFVPAFIALWKRWRDRRKTGLHNR